MKYTFSLIVLTVLTSGATINAQEIETYHFNYAKSYNNTIIYKRVISFFKKQYHVKDYYPNGQIQLEGMYSSLDKEIKEKSLWCNHKINTNKVYLTGVSLGGSGTWYLAMKYPEKLAAIAPMSGSTRHMHYISNNTDKQNNIPILAFHGKNDKIVEFEDTEWIINKLKE